MKTRIFLFSILILVLFSGCFNSSYKEPALPEPIVYTVLQHSPLFNEKNTSFTLDSGNHTLFIRLSLKNVKNFPFPVNQKFHDTLFKTAFNFDLYCNNQPIPSEYNYYHDWGWYKDSSLSSHQLSMCSDTSDLRSFNDITIQIPFYAFHHLKKGKQSIELRIWQTVFTDALSMKTDSGYQTFHLYENKPLLNAKVKFEIPIPAIYESKIIGYGLQLKNDSTFNPAGMDNTIWKSSYPDIYWMVYYPTDEFYAKTSYQTSTDKYEGSDTFNIYHYYSDDSIGIGVFDHDNLSRDDNMGYWIGSMEKLSKQPINQITFGNVKSFDAKIVKLGIVN